MLHKLETTQEKARLEIEYAPELTRVARMFGAKTKHEARKRPGGFDRPVVGHDTDYFERCAKSVVSRAIRNDEALGALRYRAWSLSDEIKESVYSLNGGGIVVGSAVELVEVTTAIQESLAEKDLKIELSGKWLERAMGISAFALRVIDEHPNHLLYAGLSLETPTNTPDYWRAVSVQLHAPALQD